jgi:nucleoside 2-deoxyribosyltransferase
MNVYLAGPMRGKPFHGFPVFDAAAKALRDSGFVVWSPSEYSQALGFKYDCNDERLEGPNETGSLDVLALWDFARVVKSDAVVLLPDSEESEGAIVEVAIAHFCKKPVWAYRATKLHPGFIITVVKPVKRIEPAIENALARIRKIFASKNADYRDNTEPWDGNFRDIAKQMDFDRTDATEVLIATKQARLRALRANKSKPNNESIDDTILDRAVYSVMALAQIMEQ